MAIYGRFQVGHLTTPLYHGVMVVLEPPEPIRCTRSHTPNAKTAKILRESAQGINIRTFNSADELFDDLGL